MTATNPTYAHLASYDDARWPSTARIAHTVLRPGKTRANPPMSGTGKPSPLAEDKASACSSPSVARRPSKRKRSAGRVPSQSNVSPSLSNAQPPRTPPEYSAAPHPLNVSPYARTAAEHSPTFIRATPNRLSTPISQLTPPRFAKISPAIARAIEESERAAAKARSGTRTDLEPPGKLPGGSKGQARDKVAQSVGCFGLPRGDPFFRGRFEPPEHPTTPLEVCATLGVSGIAQTRHI